MVVFDYELIAKKMMIVAAMHLFDGHNGDASSDFARSHDSDATRYNGGRDSAKHR